jgi:hypothetical protein
MGIRSLVIQTAMLFLAAISAIVVSVLLQKAGVSSELVGAFLMVSVGAAFTVYFATPVKSE